MTYMAYNALLQEESLPPQRSEKHRDVREISNEIQNLNFFFLIPGRWELKVQRSSTIRVQEKAYNTCIIVVIELPAN